MHTTFKGRDDQDDTATKSKSPKTNKKSALLSK